MTLCAHTVELQQKIIKKIFGDLKNIMYLCSQLS